MFYTGKLDFRQKLKQIILLILLRARARVTENDSDYSLKCILSQSRIRETSWNFEHTKVKIYLLFKS